ncbi:MAG TPA: type II toxin-antitoxin system RelE/ParE family toxin [Puia sp.]|nr:type II toxin-antitoxin system RelE/ParE family toxin [Puia sp.]
MVIQFKNAYLEKLFEGKAVPGKPRYSSDVIAKFKKTILKLQFIESFSELSRHKGLNFESLRGNYKGYFSVRVDKGYRLILSVDKAGTVNISEVLSVHDLNNHYQ